MHKITTVPDASEAALRSEAMVLVRLGPSAGGCVADDHLLC